MINNETLINQWIKWHSCLRKGKGKQFPTGLTYMLVHTLDRPDRCSFVISDDSDRRTIHCAADSDQTISPRWQDHMTYEGDHRDLLCYTDTRKVNKEIKHILCNSPPTKDPNPAHKENMNKCLNMEWVMWIRLRSVVSVCLVVDTCCWGPGAQLSEKATSSYSCLVVGY